MDEITLTKAIEAQTALKKLACLLDGTTLTELAEGIEAVMRPGNGEVGVVFKQGRAIVVKFMVSKSVQR